VGTPPRRWVLRTTRAVAVAIGFVAVSLLLTQHRLIYLPRIYPADIPPGSRIERLTFSTGEGTQVCWWVPPQTPGAGFWLCFAGNASLARSTWSEVLTTSDGLLLIDYPGYGESAGSASPASILAATEGAVAALRARGFAGVLRGVVGHSLGAASALQYAARHPVERIVLIAPFTTMLDMARRVVGWPFCHLLLHRFDNRARLAEITAAGHPKIDLWHGAEDEVVPFAMGRQLAEEFPTIRFHRVVDGDHNGILGEIAPRLLDP